MLVCGSHEGFTKLNEQFNDTGITYGILRPALPMTRDEARAHFEREGVENIDEVFVPFYSTRDDGSGIGLSLSKEIIHLHGGDIRLKSVPNKETIFTIQL